MQARPRKMLARFVQQQAIENGLGAIEGSVEGGRIKFRNRFILKKVLEFLFAEADKDYNK